MKQFIKHKLEYTIAIILLVVGICAIVYEVHNDGHRDSFEYIIRSSSFILLGCLLMYYCYRIIKHRKRFAVRTFPETIDDILGAQMWKQLGYLFLLSMAAFLFSWLLLDAIDPRDASNDNQLLGNHETFWLTICYFFDPGNLNLTPHEAPDWQGVISLVVAVLGMTLLTGLFISTFTNVLDRRVNMVRAGLVTYKKIRNHSVVIGYCDLTESVIRGLLEGDDSMKVVLLTNQYIENVRKSLYSLLNNKDYDGRIVLYSGDYRMEENLLRLNLPVTRNIYTELSQVNIHSSSD